MPEMFMTYDKESGSPTGFYQPYYDEDGTLIEEPGKTLVTEEQWLDLLQGGRVWRRGRVVDAPPFRPTPDQITEGFRRAIQAKVDEAAQSKRYDGGASMASYVYSTNEQWAAEALAFVAWRDAVWLYAYAELDKVLAGDREIPDLEEFLAELPELEWPT